MLRDILEQVAALVALSLFTSSIIVLYFIVNN